MSNPGFQMTPELMQAMQQYQQQQKQQALAQSLIQTNANPQTPNSGIANAGSAIAGALAAKNMQNQNQQTNMLQQRYGNSIDPTTAAKIASSGPSWISSLFNLGGGS